MSVHRHFGFTFLLLPMLLVSAFWQGQPNTTPGLYIAVGDSIAAGVGSSLPRERSYPAILHDWMVALNDTSVPMVNLARPGETAETFVTDGQLADLRAEVVLAEEAGIPVAAITVSLGGNEILDVAGSGISDRQAALAEFQDALDSAVSEIRSIVGSDVPVVLTTYYDPTGGDPTAQFSDSWWIAQFNMVIVEVAEQHGCAVADIAGSFEGNIDEFTLYPADVHPTNRGYLAIARQVWTALNFDSEAPVVEVRSPETATRTTPTLQFDASDNVDVADVVIGIGEDTVVEPIQLLNGSWVTLIDLSSAQGSAVEIEIFATDDAGNGTTVSHTIELDIG